MTAPILNNSKNEVKRMYPIKNKYLILFLKLMTEKILKVILKKLEDCLLDITVKLFNCYY
jgi:hypothetical protein